MSDLFKDQELLDALDDVSSSVNAVRISSILHDPATFTRLMERMGILQALLVKKLAKEYKEYQVMTNRYQSKRFDIP
jgi:hypothetical protein